MSSPIAIGIDLGTTSSRIAAFRDGKPYEVFSTPSYISFTEEGRTIGVDAKYYIAENTLNTVFGTQRLVGRRYSDPTVKSYLAHWPFKVVCSAENEPLIQVQEEGTSIIFTPEDIASIILIKLKRRAEKSLNSEVKDAVITVPSGFTYSQRQVIMNAASLVGLNVLQLINKSSAVALSYAFGRTQKEKKNILIFRFGGGSTDASVVTIESGRIEVKATTGSCNIGGEDIDNRMVNHFCDEFKTLHDKDLFSDAQALIRLRMACVRAKITLSSATQASIKLDSLIDGIHFHTSITRDRFEELCLDLFKSACSLAAKSLRDAKIDKSEIDLVYLDGESTNIPRISELFNCFFKPRVIGTMKYPQSVLRGAAIQAAILSEDHDLRNIYLTDVAPHSLGIEDSKGVMVQLIKRNSPLPLLMSHTFRTRLDKKSTINLKIYERRRKGDQHHIKGLTFPGMQFDNFGMNEIEVTMDIDLNGVLRIIEMNRTSGFWRKIIIPSNKRSMPDDYDREMVGKQSAVDVETMKKRNEARKQLLGYVSHFRTAAEDSRVKLHLIPGGKEKIVNKCVEISRWFLHNEDFEMEDIDRKKRELKEFAAPLIIQCFQNLLLDISPGLSDLWTLSRSN